MTTSNAVRSGDVSGHDAENIIILDTQLRSISYWNRTSLHTNISLAVSYIFRLRNF